MSDVVLVAIVSSVPATLAAAVSYLNSRKLDNVHTLVNSNLTKVKEDLAAAQMTIEELKSVIYHKEKIDGNL